MFCTECGIKIEDKSNFCHECGAEILSDNNYCTKCGCKLDNNLNHCQKCNPQHLSESECISTTEHKHLTIQPSKQFSNQQAPISDRRQKYEQIQEKEKNDQTLTGECSFCFELLEFKAADENSDALCPYCNNETKLIRQNEERVLYNHNHATLLSLFFTPIFGSYINKRNWYEFGENSNAKVCKTWMTVLTLIYYLTFLFTSYFFGTKLPNSNIKIFVSVVAVVTISYILWYVTEHIKYKNYLLDAPQTKSKQKSLLYPALMFLILSPIIILLFYLIREAVIVMALDIFFSIKPPGSFICMLFVIIICFGIFARAKLKHL
tara:strand:- start:329 stop:1288 length:960 start_codon:yes stop_codon:yes gene_type:complete